MAVKKKTAKQATVHPEKAASQNEEALRYPHGRFDTVALSKRGVTKPKKTPLAARD
ncbi:hypothetical protein [Deminuibacter soli]|uniref:hypothetical protein n=1 Tax=Deminuibacter soli TaxID=2291815 RepID=UPI0013149CE5|nr:hypothetical protein [Deminuibacter soli]